MKVGYLTLGENRWPGLGRDDASYYLDYLVLAEALDKLDYSSFWAGEHHFAHVAALSSPTTVLAAIAARTENIRLATAVNALAFHHPVRYAEDLATLDVLSGGRAMIGAGVGYAKGEFEGFGVDIANARKLQREVLTIARSALDTGKFGLSGEFYRTTGQPLVPAPVQQPFPTYVALSGSWETVEWAARNNHNLITSSQSPATTRRSLPKTIAHFQRTRQENGFGPGKVAVPWFTMCSLSEEKIAAEFQRMIDYWRHLSGDLDKDLPDHLGYWIQLKDTLEKLTVDDLHNRQTAFGTPERLVEIFLNVAAAGVDEILVESFYGPQTIEEAVENAEAVREHVMPYVDERFGGPEYGWDGERVVLVQDADHKLDGVPVPPPAIPED